MIRWGLAGAVAIAGAFAFQNCAPSIGSSDTSTATSTVAVGSNGATLVVSPSTVTLNQQATQAFVVSGGSSPYTLIPENGCGSSSGLTYTAPASATTCTLLFTDSQGRSGLATVTTVTATTTTTTTTSTPTLSTQAVYLSSNGYDYLSSLSSSEGPNAGYNSNGTAFSPYSTSVSGFTQLVRCVFNPLRHTVSTSGCGGGNQEAILGYVAPSSGSYGTVAVYICTNAYGANFATTSTSLCNNVAGSVGNVVGYLPQ